MTTLTAPPPTPAPVRSKGASFGIKFTTTLFLVAPLLAIAAVIAFQLTPTWHMITLTVILYYVSMFGVTIGWHRYLTHSGFRVNPTLRYVLVAAGCAAFQGAPVGWVATHRKHHKFSDKPGDPHSPWTVKPGRFFTLRGWWHAQAGWLYDGENAEVDHYAPDLLKDPIVMKVERVWWMWGLLFLVVIPGIVGALIDGWLGAVTCILWAGFIRLGLSHFFAWMTNSAGHIWGNRPFRSRDNSTNTWWMVPFTVGEGWHNGHHAYGTSPRHGLLKHQWDPSARIIRWFERAGWATNVKWMNEEQIAKKLKPRSEWRTHTY